MVLRAEKLVRPAATGWTGQALSSGNIGIFLDFFWRAFFLAVYFARRFGGARRIQILNFERLGAGSGMAIALTRYFRVLSGGEGLLSTVGSGFGGGPAGVEPLAFQARRAFGLPLGDPSVW